MWMLLGAAIGAQLGTIATKYVRGYAIRLLFAATIFTACGSIVLKQLEWQAASSVVILAAAIVICGVIISWLCKGVASERAAARARAAARQAREEGA